MSVSPSPTPRFGQEVRATATLALPLVLGHVSTGLIGFVDNVIAGHHATATLAAVTVGTALRSPELNRAQHHHYNALGRVLDQLDAMGCRRPVLLTQRGQAHRAYLAAFLAWRGAECAKDVNSEPYFEDDLAAWVRRRRADVVVTENDELLAMASGGGGQLETRFGGVSLDVDDPAGRVSGVYKDTRRTGECAIDLLLQARFRHETGVPAEPLTVMNEGVWVAGETLAADAEWPLTRNDR